MNKLAPVPIALLFALTPARAAEVTPTLRGEGVLAAPVLEPLVTTPSPPAAPDKAAEGALPEEATPQPTSDEWKAAVPFELARRSAAASSCEASRVREWLRIRCPNGSLGAVKTLGANRRGEVLRIEETRGAEGFWSTTGAEIVFPMRRGDRRVVEALTLESGYRGPSGFSTAFVVSEQWILGEASPLVTVL